MVIIIKIIITNNKIIIGNYGFRLDWSNYVILKSKQLINYEF